MIDNLAAKITKVFIKESIIAKDEFRVYYYCFETIISKIIFYSTIFMIAALTNNVQVTIFYYLGFWPLRFSCGGYHADTHMKCYLMSISIYSLNMGVINILPYKFYCILILGAYILSVPLVYVCAPIDHVNRRFSEKEKNILRRRSRIIVIVLLLSTLMVFNAYQKLAWAISCGVFSATISLIIAWLKRKEDLKHDKKIIV